MFLSFFLLPNSLYRYTLRARIENPRYRVIIGGLISSLFLTLIIVPVIYEIMEKIKARLTKDEKIDYEAEMVADYDHKELSEDGFNPKHTV